MGKRVAGTRMGRGGKATMETGRRHSTLMTMTVSSEEDKLSFVVEKLCSVLCHWLVCVCVCV